MLTAEQKRAVRLMFRMTDEEVAAELGVNLETIEKWKQEWEFASALLEEERNVRAATARMATEASLRAARNLHNQLAENKDAKLSLDTLKASGAFEEREDSADQALDAMLRRTDGESSNG